MNYNESLEYIHGISWTFCKPGLERISALCEALGHPERELKFVHVAGTNGKGSTSHMIAAALQKNHRVGLYTSPHLVDFRERIKISAPDGFEMISKEYVYSFINLYKGIAAPNLRCHHCKCIKLILFVNTGI